MNRSKLVTVLMIVCFLALAFTAKPGPVAAAKRHITIAAGWVTGVYFPLSGAISRILYKKSKDLRATVESSGASKANALAMRAGDVDFALLQNDVAYYAYTGTSLFKGVGKVPNIRGVMCIYPETIHIVQARGVNAKSVADLKGKKVAVGPLGSGTEFNTKQIMEIYGLSFDDLARAERLKAEEALDYLKDGRIDAGFFTTGVGNAGITNLAIEQKGIEFIPVPPSDVAKLKKKYPFYAATVIPKDAYTGMKEDVQSATVLAMMAVRAEVEDELVYNLLSSVFENINMFYSAHKMARNLTLESALDGMPIPLHPGAERFFREKGVLK